MRHDLHAKVKTYIPGASLGVFHLPDDLRPIIVKGEGAHITDTNGKVYIDYILGSGPLVLGHAHPEVVEAVTRQAERGSSYYLLNEPAILLAEKIVEAVPCGESIRYQLGGSDATYNALRLARAVTGRTRIIKFEGGFHGWHDVAQHSIQPRPEARPDARPESAGISNSLTAEVRVARFNDLDSVARIVAEEPDDIAAIIVEPVQRVLPPSKGFLEGLREIATRNGIMLIFDEVVTGFRLAWGGAQELYGVRPDLACYGKAIGGGYPLSAIVGRTDILERSDSGARGAIGYCYLSGTLTGNPISTSAGLATLGVLEREGAYVELDRLADGLRLGLEQVCREAGVEVAVVGVGSVAQLLFTPRRKFEFLEDFGSADKGLARMFAYEMISRGIMISPDSKLYVSLAHTSELIEQTVATAGLALRAVLARRQDA